MARAKTYQTHTGLLIAQTQDEDMHIVSITGDREKELLRTPDQKAATKYFNGLKAHYEERKTTDPKVEA